MPKSPAIKSPAKSNVVRPIDSPAVKAFKQAALKIQRQYLSQLRTATDLLLDDINWAAIVSASNRRLRPHQLLEVKEEPEIEIVEDSESQREPEQLA